jgi:hypothetical protein
LSAVRWRSCWRRDVMVACLPADGRPHCLMTLIALRAPDTERPDAGITAQAID